MYQENSNAIMASPRERCLMAAIGICLTIIGGLFFYWLRCRFRFWYGLCEIVVAVVVIYLSFVPPYTAMALADMSLSRLQMSKAIGILGGVYILVRGMDNVDQDLPSKWRSLWDRTFPKPIRDRWRRPSPSSPRCWRSSRQSC